MTEAPDAKDKNGIVVWMCLAVRKDFRSVCDSGLCELHTVYMFPAGIIAEPLTDMLEKPSPYEA